MDSWVVALNMFIFPIEESSARLVLVRVRRVNGGKAPTIEFKK